ncbi:hypothetical protein [Aestuariimicrobium sp. Y1814]|uniref:hypothetical protein n=1 Tax=Aestuariimicrobium sp. Y1814 TaxID=3418742 RepID=UPI003DA74590
MNNKISYALTETVINLTARTVTVTDPYTNGGSPTTRVEDLAVEVANAADPNDRVEVELYKGDRSVTATLAPDGRLRALEYNSVGVGTKVVSSVGKVVAFVGSIAAAIASRAGGLPAGQDGGGDVRTGRLLRQRRLRHVPGQAG